MTTPSINGFDPYQAMLRRNQTNVSDESGYINVDVQQYDVKDIQALEEFCQQYGIMGFNFGKMNPKSALRMLKGKMGIVDEKVNNKKILFDQCEIVIFVMVKLINAVNSPLNIEVLVDIDINDVDAMFLWEDDVTKIPLHSELIKLHANTGYFSGLNKK